MMACAGPDGLGVGETLVLRPSLAQPMPTIITVTSISQMDAPGEQRRMFGATPTLANRHLRDELAHGLERRHPLEDGHQFQGRITAPVEAHRAHQAAIVLRLA